MHRVHTSHTPPGPLGVEPVLCRVRTTLCERSLKRVIFDHLMWSCTRQSSPDRVLPVLGHVELSVRCTNGDCEKAVLSAVPPVTGFLCQKHRPLSRSMHVPLPARYSSTEILALCIAVSPPFPSWLHSSTAQHPCSCAKTPPLQTKERAQHYRQQRREWRGVRAPHTPKHSNYSCEK